MFLTCMSNCVPLPGYFYQSASPYGDDTSAPSGYLNYAMISWVGDPGDQLSNSRLAMCGGMIHCCKRKKEQVGFHMAA